MISFPCTIYKSILNEIFRHRNRIKLLEENIGEQMHKQQKKNRKTELHETSNFLQIKENNE